MNPIKHISRQVREYGLLTRFGREKAREHLPKSSLVLFYLAELAFLIAAVFWIVGFFFVEAKLLYSLCLLLTIVGAALFYALAAHTISKLDFMARLQNLMADMGARIQEFNAYFADMTDNIQELYAMVDEWNDKRIAAELARKELEEGK